MLSRLADLLVKLTSARLPLNTGTVRRTSQFTLGFISYFTELNYNYNPKAIFVINIQSINTSNNWTKHSLIRTATTKSELSFGTKSMPNDQDNFTQFRNGIPVLEELPTIPLVRKILDRSIESNCSQSKVENLIWTNNSQQKYRPKSRTDRRTDPRPLNSTNASVSPLSASECFISSQ